MLLIPKCENYILYKCTHFLLFLSLSTVYNSSIPLLYEDCHPDSPNSHPDSPHSYPNSPRSHPYSSYSHLNSLHPTQIPRIPTQIPCILTLIPRIPTMIPHIPIIPTLISRIFIITLIAFPDSQFRLLQIAQLSSLMTVGLRNLFRMLKIPWERASEKVCKYLNYSVTFKTNPTYLTLKWLFDPLILSFFRNCVF